MDKIVCLYMKLFTFPTLRRWWSFSWMKWTAHVDQQRFSQEKCPRRIEVLSNHYRTPLPFSPGASPVTEEDVIAGSGGILKWKMSITLSCRTSSRRARSRSREVSEVAYISEMWRNWSGEDIQPHPKLIGCKPGDAMHFGAGWGNCWPEKPKFRLPWHFSW